MPWRVRLRDGKDSRAFCAIAAALLEAARTALPQLYRVDLFETRGCGVVVSTGQDGPQLPL
jgi:6-pyruvoyltetrahydropterin/6-carboxytetrahydropterin synthase